MTFSHTLEAYGWTDAVAASLPEQPTHIPGRVVRVDRGECDVVTGDGIRRARTTLSVCTGDWVNLDEHSRVVYLAERRSGIYRASASGRSQSQALAANVDTVVILTAADRSPKLNRVERLLALAWESGGQPVLVLSKCDAMEDVSGFIHQLAQSAPGVAVLPISARTGMGIGELIGELSGTSVLLGQSGAGKSTLANHLLGAELHDTAEVRAVDGKGRHTTVTRELVPLPFGGTLIDTPGLRGIGVVDAKEGLEKAFADVDGLAARCRFADCAHHGEPGCAVLAAVQTGELDERRLDNFRRLNRENDWAALRSDARLRAERTRAVKIQAKAIRQHYRHRPPDR